MPPSDYRRMSELTYLANRNKKAKKEQEQQQEYDQPWYLDALDFISRPYYAVTGAVANATDKDKETGVLEGAYKGIMGKEKTDFSEILNNAGWYQNEENEGYNWLKGRKGNSWYAPDLFDLVNFAGGMGLDPTTYTGIGGLAKASASAAVKGAAKDVAEKATENIAGDAVKLGKSVTVKGQNKAIDKLLDDIAQKTVDKSATLNVDDFGGLVAKSEDDILSDLSDLQKQRSLIQKQKYNYIEQQAQAGKNIDELDLTDFENSTKYYDNLIGKNTQALRDYKAATTPLNRDLVGRTYGKQIEDAVKGSRVEGQNSLLSLNLPFTKFEKSFLKKPEWSGLVYRDLPIGAKEAGAANEALRQAFTSTEDAKRIKELAETKPQGYKEQIKQIEDSISEKSKELLESAYGKGNVDNLTTQEFQDLLQRTSNINTRNLPDAKVTEAMVDAQTGKPVFDVAKDLQGYQSKYLRDFSVTGIPKETRKKLDELDYYLNIIESNKGMIPKDLDKNFLEFVSKNVSGKGKNKGKDINDIIQKRIEDLKSGVDFNKYARFVTPTSKSSSTGVDFSEFVADAGGTSAIRSKLAKNIFNARTLRSKNNNVNDMGDEIVDANNQVLGRRRETENMLVNLKRQTKGLSDDQIKSLVYIVQKEFPDRMLDEDVAKDILDMRVNLKELKEQYKAIKNSKSQAKIQQAGLLKTQIDDLTKQIEKMRGSNKPSFKESILKIANGDAKLAKKLENTARQIGRVSKEIKRADEAAGDVYETRANYFPHVMAKSNQELIELESIYKDDPEIGALINKSQTNNFAKERKSYQTMAEVDNALSVMQERLLKAEEEGLDTTDLANKIKVVESLYERDPFTALTKRYNKSIKANAMRDLFKTLTRNGYVIEKSKETPKFEKTSRNDYYEVLDSKEAKALGLAEGTKVHKEVLDGLKKVQDVFTDKGIEKALRNLEAVNNVFKTLTTTVLPSHYWYNFVGLVTNNTMAGVSISSYAEAQRLLNARRTGKLTKEQQKIVNDMLDKGVLNQTSYSDLLESSFTQADNRFDDSGFLTKGFRGLENVITGKRESINKIPKGLNLPFKAYGGYVRAGRATSDVMDNFFRTAHYLDVLAKTKNTKMAADSVRKHLFNYQELTAADRGVRAFVPFWNWTKNNTPLQIEKLLKSPKYATTYEKIKEQSTQNIQDDSEIPDYLKKGDFLKLGDELYNPRLPVQDLATITDLRKSLSMISPIFRSPFEVTANHQLYKGKPIDYDKFYGNSDSYFGEQNEGKDFLDIPLMQYLLNQTGLGSRSLSGYQGITNEEDSKGLLDNIQDLLIGRSRNIEDVKNKKEYSKDTNSSSSKTKSSDYVKYLLNSYK
jgi:hypothetical protein